MRQTTLCFLLKKDQILLAMKKRGFGEGKWNGVGGKLKEGEELLDSLRREIEEEIGVTVQNSDLEKIAELDFSFETKLEWNQRCHVYFFKKWKGDPVETEEMKPEWFPVKKIPYEKMWIDDKLWLPEALGGKKIKASFLFRDDGEEILSYSIQNTSY